MSPQTKQIEALDQLCRQVAAVLAQGLELNETIRRSGYAIPLFDVTRVWNIQVFAENAIKNLELKARGVSRRVRAA